MYIRILKEAIGLTNQEAKKKLYPFLGIALFFAIVIGGMFGIAFVLNVLVGLLVDFMAWDKIAGLFIFLVVTLLSIIPYMAYVISVGMRFEELYKKHQKDKAKIIDEFTR